MRLLYVRDEPARRGGELDDELDDGGLVDLYRHPAGAGETAWVRTNFVATLDGSISGPDGRSGSINTPSDQRVFALHRALADVILVGAQTVRTEGYRAVDLADWQREVRIREGLSDYPTLAVVTGSLDLDPALATPSQTHGPVVIITAGHAEADLDRFTDVGIKIIQTADVVDLVVAVRALAAAGLPRVLCEGGPRLHRDLLAADLVDELSLTLSPTVVGGDGQRSTSGGPLPEQLGFALHHALWADDETLFLSYRGEPRPRRPAR